MEKTGRLSQHIRPWRSASLWCTIDSREHSRVTNCHECEYPLSRVFICPHVVFLKKGTSVRWRVQLYSGNLVDIALLNQIIHIPKISFFCRCASVMSCTSRASKLLDLYKLNFTRLKVGACVVASCRGYILASWGSIVGGDVVWHL